MDASFKPPFRWGSLATWSIGCLIVLGLNGWNSHITNRHALFAGVILLGGFAAFLFCLLVSGRARRVVIRDEAEFMSHRGQWGCAVATLLVIATAFLFTLI